MKSPVTPAEVRAAIPAPDLGEKPVYRSPLISSQKKIPLFDGMDFLGIVGILVALAIIGPIIQKDIKANDAKKEKYQDAQKSYQVQLTNTVRHEEQYNSSWMKFLNARWQNKETREYMEILRKLALSEDDRIILTAFEGGYEFRSFTREELQQKECTERGPWCLYRKLVFLEHPTEQQTMYMKAFEGKFKNDFLNFLPYGFNAMNHDHTKLLEALRTKTVPPLDMRRPTPPDEPTLIEIYTWNHLFILISLFYLTQLTGFLTLYLLEKNEYRKAQIKNPKKPFNFEYMAFTNPASIQPWWFLYTPIKLWIIAFWAWSGIKVWRARHAFNQKLATYERESHMRQELYGISQAQAEDAFWERFDDTIRAQYEACLHQYDAIDAQIERAQTESGREELRASKVKWYEAMSQLIAQQNERDEINRHMNDNSLLEIVRANLAKAGKEIEWLTKDTNVGRDFVAAAEKVNGVSTNM